MAKKYAAGRHAWGICGRSGRKMLLADMVFDGQFPNMRVDPDWYEPKHPQENLLKLDDPVALWRPSPEVIDPPTPPVLDGTSTGGGEASVTGVNLNDHAVRVTGQLGSGSQQPQLWISMNRDTGSFVDVFPLGSLVFFKGTGQQLYVDGVAFPTQQDIDGNEWWNDVSPPTEADYEVRLTVQSGVSPDAGPVDTWVAMTALNTFGPVWGIQVSFGATTDVITAAWLIEIRRASDQVVLDSGLMSLTFDYEPIS